MVGKSGEEPVGTPPEPVATGRTVPEEAERKLIIARSGPREASRAVPILFVRRRKKRRKRYTRGTKELQRLQQAFTRASFRLSNAGTLGFERFDRKSRQSARNKRDGAVVDALDNVALGMSAALREASRVPVEVAKGLNSRLLGRGAKYAARVVIPPAPWR